ncbi:hypothetical protein [Rubellimicrobium roseum]|uniref:hypothetical protein n=1 Tax=Rubellimicrobium roseum TaxID=687525 RepID=UPI00159BD24B|nr:hypothetical protein [Rubellimicrobium roseum]
MNTYQTWKSAVDFWAAMAQAPAVVTLRMMDMNRRRAVRRAEPMARAFEPPVAVVTATVVPFARAEAPAPVEPVAVIPVEAAAPPVVETTVPPVEPLEATEDQALAAEPVEPTEALAPAAEPATALTEEPEAAPAEHIPAEILSEASPAAILAAIEPEPEAAPSVEPPAPAEPAEPLAVLAEAAPAGLVEAAMLPILEQAEAPAPAEIAAAAKSVSARPGRRLPPSRRNGRPKSAS